MTTKSTTPASTKISLPNNPCKSEEVDVLFKLQQWAVEHNCYLASLFTNDLIKWAKYQIESDFAPDVIEALNYQQREYNDAADNKGKLEVEINRLNRNIETLKTSASVAATIAAETLEATRAKLSDANQALYESQRSYKELADDYRNLEEVNEQQQHQIIELKAKLYDLMIPSR